MKTLMFGLYGILFAVIYTFGGFTFKQTGALIIASIAILIITERTKDDGEDI